MCGTTECVCVCVYEWLCNRCIASATIATHADFARQRTCECYLAVCVCVCARDATFTSNLASRYGQPAFDWFSGHLRATKQVCVCVRHVRAHVACTFYGQLELMFDRTLTPLFGGIDRRALSAVLPTRAPNTNTHSRAHAHTIYVAL